MSKNIIKIIANKVDYIPKGDELDLITKILKQFDIDYDLLEQVLTDHIRFVDCGSNLEYIRCPYCYRDALSWWGDAMEKSATNGFFNRVVITPCCENTVLLEELEYVARAGFAKYSIEIHEPTQEIDDILVEYMSERLGVELMRIPARY